MANTTNFNWETPDDTDLVKDGAAAIRTLGNSIDTSLVDLKGGTTGQVLSKNSNTDLDYTWITPNVGDITEVQAGTGISVASGTGPIPVVTNTIATAFDAKGDLVAGTGDDTFAKLTVGANNTVLTADSSTSTGLKWAAPSGASYVGFSGDTNNSETIPNATYTEFTMEVEQWDTDGFHSTVTNIGRVTIPAGKAGKYLISGTVMWNAAIDADNEVRAVIYKNGNQERFFNAFTSSAGDEPYAPNYTCVLNLAEGDYIQLYRWHNAGGNESTGNGSPMTVTYLGA